MSFIAELKRRSVFKVGAAYAVIGWVSKKGTPFRRPCQMANTFPPCS